VLGFDIVVQWFYTGRFIEADIRDISGFDYPDVKLVVASPPCQEFSYRHLPFGRIKNLSPPDKSIWLGCERIAWECQAPLVLENVRGAQEFFGKAKARYGSYYLWGDVPALLPTGNPTKGFGHNFQGRTKCGRPINSFSSGSKQRREWSADVAMIPFELAFWIGQCFENANKSS
jgi:hypothetical protein